MKSYKIWILFILLSAVSFGVKLDDKSNENANGNVKCGLGEAANSGIAVWIESVGYNSDTKIFYLIIKTKTGEKFGIPVGEIKSIVIESKGVKEVFEDGVSLIYSKDVRVSPKVISTFTATISTTLSIGETVSIMGEEIKDSKNNLYIYTKGGDRSYITNPGVYVGGSMENSVGRVAKLDVKNITNGTVDTIVIPFDENVTSFTALEKGSTTKTVTIDPSGLIAGSKGTLLFTVYDKLGHEKIFEKTYFIPKQLEGITSKVGGESKQRESKIKVVTEGNNDKFGVGSSTDTSSEDN